MNDLTISPMITNSDQSKRVVESFEIGRESTASEASESTASQASSNKQKNYANRLWKAFMRNILKYKIELMIEGSAVIIIFSLALWYFLNKASTATLQLTENSSACRPFKNVYSIQSQYSTLTFAYSLYMQDFPNQPLSEMNMTAVQLSAQWRSCAMSAVSEQAPSLKFGGSWQGEYHNNNFNISAQNETTEKVVAVSYAGKFIYQDNNTVLSVTVFDKSCFQLLCQVYYGESFYDGPDQTTLVTNSNIYPNGGLGGQIIFTDTSVSASCSASLFGVPVNYFSVSNSIQLSDSGQCTVYYGTFSAISLSLPFAMTAFSVLKALLYFRGQMKG
jgi:hypothetical protein